MVYQTVFNRLDTPVVIDTEGRSIGGGEWGTVNTEEEAVKRALEAEWLTEVEEREDTDNIDPRAAEAFEQTRKMRGESETKKKRTTNEMTSKER